MRSNCVRWLVFITSLLLVPGFAEGADHEALIREGVAHRRAGDDLAALNKFQQAYELNKTPRALAQIGLAEQALGRWAAADKHLRQALESADDPWIRKNRGSIDESLSVIARHIGQLEVSGTPAGAEVRVDGELVGQLPLSRPITVTAGGVALDVRAPGYVPILRAATITARTLTRETFNLQPLTPLAHQGIAAGAGAGAGSASEPAPPSGVTTAPAASGVGSPSAATSPGSPDAPAALADEPPRRRGWVLAAGGLSAASLAFAIVEHVIWQRRVASFRSTPGCGTNFGGNGGPACDKLVEEGDSALTLALVGYGLTAAFAATAAILHFTDRPRGSESAQLACVPVPGPAAMAAQLHCAIRF